MDPSKLTEREEYIGKEFVHAAYLVHKELGPGLLEKVYEACMEHVLKNAGLDVKRQATWLPDKLQCTLDKKWD